MDKKSRNGESKGSKREFALSPDAVRCTLSVRSYVSTRIVVAISGKIHHHTHRDK